MKTGPNFVPGLWHKNKMNKLLLCSVLSLQMDLRDKAAQESYSVRTPTVVRSTWAEGFGSCLRH